MKRYFVFVICLFIINCDQDKHKHHNFVKEQMHVYKEQISNNGSVDWIYWYILFNNFNNSYIYSSSSTPISPLGYSAMSWKSSNTSPIAQEEGKIEEETSLEQKVEVDKEANPNEQPEVETESQAQSETATENSTTESNTSSSESSESSSSSDAGSSSDGGGGCGSD